MCPDSAKMSMRRRYGHDRVRSPCRRRPWAKVAGASPAQGRDENALHGAAAAKNPSYHVLPMSPDKSVTHVPGCTVLFTPAFVDIQVNGQQEFRVQGPFKSGRFGCYNFSQSGMEFQFPVQGSFVEFGQACAGTVGSPYLFTPVTPYFGERMPLVLGTIPSTGPALLFLGFSNTNWGAFNLPLDLSPLGARGCSLFFSGDVVQAMPNYKGTGFLDFQLPTVFLPATTFYVQGAAIDASANALGMIFSNAGTVTVGVR